MVSVAIHLLMVFLFFLINAWTAPDPPLPEYGIELNFGIEQAGSGTRQPVTQPTPPTVEEQGEPEKQVEPEPEKIVEEQPVVEPVESSPAKELPDSKQTDSPVETKPEVKPVNETPKPKEVTESKPVAKPAEVKPVEQPKVEEKKPDPRALMKPGSSSQGDKQNKAGDVGITDGKKDATPTSGKQGGGDGGPSLDLDGWRWIESPDLNDKSKENGKIVFKIRVDQNGEVTILDITDRTVSNSVLLIYREAVNNLRFEPAPGITNPKPAEGTITFIIRSN